MKEKKETHKEYWSRFPWYLQPDEVRDVKAKKVIRDLSESEYGQMRDGGKTWPKRST